MRALALALSLSFFAIPAQAAELIMYDRDGCYYCMQWKNKVGKYYGKTREGIVAPLTNVDLGDPIPERLKNLKKPVISPTFVLVHEGREVGRIRGYPGEKRFWMMMGALMDQSNILPKATP